MMKDHSENYKRIKEYIFEVVLVKFMDVMNEVFNTPISKAKLLEVVQEIVLGEALGLDGFRVEFFTKCYDFIGKDYYYILSEAIHKQKFPSKVMNGIITLIHK
jgi:hypothetical protein